MSSENVTATGNELDIDKKYREYYAEGRIEFITFHPAYSYEEFIEGITVELGEENKPTDKLQYKLRTGLFKDLCRRALGAAIGYEPNKIAGMSWGAIYKDYVKQNEEKSVTFEDAPKFVLIIDEINRGDIAKIFGELITLLEADKRIGADNELIVRLPKSKDLFGVPPNVYIVATMNTADRSIALLDVALRRRFGFIEKNPDFNVIREEHLEKNKRKLEATGVYDQLNRTISAVEKINKKICNDTTIGRDRQIGHSFFFKIWNPNDLVLLWKHEILPLLEEYCYSNYEKINDILFNKPASDTWISKSAGIKGISAENLNSFVDEILSADRADNA